MLALGLLAAPAAFAEDTTTTFTVTAGALGVTVPESADLGDGAPGTTITGQLGTVTVSDLRGANPAAWRATVSSTDFTATGVPSIPASAVTYTPGTATTVGDGTFTPGAPGPLSSTPRDAYTHSAGTGSNSAAWNPTLAVAVPNTATATTYQGTVTHSVATV
ncbi:hypothetical protein GCM10023085_40790 [Actinomadura viridis]